MERKKRRVAFFTIWDGNDLIPSGIIQTIDGRLDDALALASTLNASVNSFGAWLVLDID